MALSEDFLNELRLRCDIETIISQYVVLKKRGRSITGLCPFHSEKTPSFHVSSDKQLFYCFGCGTGGDVITFIMKIENLSYIEAVEFLAAKVGLEVPQNNVDDKVSKLKGRILEINRETAKFFYKALNAPQGAEALSYLKNRKLDDKTITRFGLGFAPNSWDSLVKHLKKKGFSEYEMVAAQVAIKSRKGNLIDFFRNRVMFPIIDLRGNVVAFGGRKLSEQDNGPKYLNSPETPVFQKNRVLYAMNFAKTSQYSDTLSKNGRDRYFILCEGYMDVIALHQAGFDNAVAPLGTALTENQVNIMSKYVPGVVIATDSDEAGQKAAKRSFELIDKAGLGTKILKLRDAKDPDEYIKKFGAERFSMLLNDSISAIENELEAIMKKYDTDTDSGKVQALKEASKALAGINNAIERDVYISRLSQKLSVSSQAIAQNINNIIRQRQNSIKRQERANLSVNVSPKDTVNVQKRKLLSAAVCEEWILGSLFCHPDFYKILKNEQIDSSSFVTDWGKKMFTVIENVVTSSDTLDLMSLSGVLSPDEMSRMAEVITKDGSRINTSEQFSELIESLKKEKRKQSISGDSIKMLDDQSLKNLIEEISKDKK